jgi:hypothetical protein
MNLQNNGSTARQFLAFVPLILVAVMNKYLSKAIKSGIQMVLILPQLD